MTSIFIIYIIKYIYIMDFYWIYSVAWSFHCRKIVRHQKKKCQDKNIENEGVSYEAGVYKENIIKYIYYGFLLNLLGRSIFPLP